MAAKDTTPVTVNECERKHRITKWMLGFLLFLMSVFVGTTVWSVRAGYWAAEQANETRHAGDVRAERVEGSLKTIQVRLDQIRFRQAESTAELKEQRKMIEDVWRRNGGGK